MIAREYGWSPREIRRLPLAEALCYQAEIMQHHEVDTSAPSFAERDILLTLKL